MNPSKAHSDNTIIMVHGWPSIWSTWSPQIQAFQNDYHLIVPDLRGFGQSSHPGNVRSSGTMQDIVSDLVCILEKAGVKKATCMGHDWGSAVCYEAARSRPDIFQGVISAVVPYISSSSDFLPISQFIPAFPKLAYQLYFDQNTDEAVAELDADIRRSLRSVFRTQNSAPPDSFLTSTKNFLGAYGDGEIPPIPFFTKEEEDYLVEQFEIQGFKDTLQFYMMPNRYQSWKFAFDQGNATIKCPVLAVYPTDDPVADWKKVVKLLDSTKHLPELTVHEANGAHWIHLENAEVFNDIVKKWLEGRTHQRDEL
ncbi:hypothetical protein AMATHDRAFT_63697 [Amanita thiersii Skay4041]|uniref:AB hydrolase-1 domain-containing protein n=1 Tax=Amanita thiersii Skay4041 TaxID=703135 RepID=A0A2A9NIG7_9AGAR|nr:hypothetical protein AMATHDRAFT_63697 [Amanita thiersii Skay4041]